MILIIAFGSLLAMGLPIVTALFGVGCGAAIIGMLTQVLAMPEFTPLIATLIGIGVGIDYSLLIVTRYRQGLRDGLEPGDAVTLAVDTSGRAVLFAGITVVISLLGLFMMNLDFMRSVALGAMSAVLMTMAASLTLLPALLGFVGRNIDRLGLPHRASGGEADVTRTFWYRWSHVIQRNPWPALVLSGAFLIALTIPVFTMRLGFSDAGNRLESDTTRRAYDLLDEAFGPGFNAPIFLVVDTANGSGDPAALAALQAALARTEGVAGVSPPQPIEAADLVLIQAFPTTAPQDEETTELVHRLRAETIPAVARDTGIRALTTGLPPLVVDFSDYTSERLPWFVGGVLVLSFILLLVVFHSVVVPLKAVIMNLLSIGAAFGLTVVVFQWGFGENLLGVGKEGPIEAWGPMFIFAIVFGLSMDYEVFLLTRVREEYDKNGHNNGLAVADGLASTGRVISAAALIMVFVFGAFMLNDDRAVKMVGFALASAIFIDATVVRLILVPSAMELMDRANWWAPEWLVRYLPTIRVDAEPEGAVEVERRLTQASFAIPGRWICGVSAAASCGSEIRGSLGSPLPNRRRWYRQLKADAALARLAQNEVGHRHVLGAGADAVEQRYFVGRPPGGYKPANDVLELANGVPAQPAAAGGVNQVTALRLGGREEFNDHGGGFADGLLVQLASI